MTHLLGDKAIDILCFIDARHADEPYVVWEMRWDRLCEKWGGKVVIRKLEELSERGYIDYGVSPHLGWLTDKGKAAIRARAAS